MSALSTIPERRAAGSSRVPRRSGEAHSRHHSSVPSSSSSSASGSGSSGGPGVDVLRGAVGQRQPDPVSGADLEAPDELVRRILGELLLAPHEQRVVAPDRAVQPVTVAADPRADLAVVEPRRDPDLELERAAHALDHAEDPALIGAVRAVADDEAVEQRRLARRSGQRGLEHERVLDVGPRVVPRPVGGRADRAVTAALAVEQPAERAARVEARQAAPVDRSVPGDERGAVAVADQRVVADRRVSVGVGHGQVTTPNRLRHRRRACFRNLPAGSANSVDQEREEF